MARYLSRARTLVVVKEAASNASVRIKERLSMINDDGTRDELFPSRLGTHQGRAQSRQYVFWAQDT
jgi:hypothetical protein